MRARLVVVTEAERQIRAADRWWHENRPAAPGLLREELTRAFELITTRPKVGTRALDTDLRGLRRLHLARSRYHLYYRERNDRTVEVVALWHTSRGSGPPLPPR